MTVTTVIQKTQVDGVGSLVITDITQDPTTGNYVRQIQAYAPPDSSGNVALMFTLLVTSPTEAAIELTAPSVQF